MARPHKFDKERNDFKDNIPPWNVTDAIFRKRYDIERDVIGSSWMIGEGGYFLTPSYYDKDEWTLVARDGHRMVMRTSNGKLIQCYDSGYKGHSIIAFGLIPETAYDYDPTTGIFKPNSKGGEIHILQDAKGYYTRHWNEYGDPVYIGKNQWFYMEPQGDLNELALSGAFGISIIDGYEVKKEKNPKAVRFCETCGAILDQMKHYSVKFCSVPCGLPDPKKAAKEKLERQMKRRVASGQRQFVKQFGREYKCVECSSTFRRKTQGNHRLCSDECREKHFAYKKRVRSLTCDNCNCSFEFHGCGNPKFCSDECRTKAREYRPKNKKKQCVSCGTSFESTGSGNHRLCSDECREKHFTYKKRVRFISCQTCTNTFEFHGCGNPRFCSDECRAVAHGYKTRERSIKCSHCSVIFKVTGAGRYRHCSDRCKRGEGPKFPLPTC